MVDKEKDIDMFNINTSWDFINHLKKKYNFDFVRVSSNSDKNYIYYRLNKYGLLQYYKFMDLNSLINDLLHIYYKDYIDIPEHNRFLDLTVSLNCKESQLKGEFRKDIEIRTKVVDEILTSPKIKDLVYTLPNSQVCFNLCKYSDHLTQEYLDTLNCCNSDFPIIKKIILNLCGNNQIAYDWLINWLAIAVQRPDIKSTNAVIFAGKYGAGKGEFSEFLRWIFKDMLQVINPDMLTNRFNSYLEGKLFIIGEEIAYTGRDNKFYVYNKLKPFITNEIIQVESKFEPLRNIVNLSRWIIFSNDKNPLAITKGDRRFMVCYPTETLIENIQYDDKGIFSVDFYNKWRQEFRELELKSFLNYLSNYKIDISQMYKEPPMTRAKKEIINLNQTNFESVIDEIITNTSFLDLCKEDSVGYITFNVDMLLDFYKQMVFREEDRYINKTKFISRLMIYTNLKISEDEFIKIRKK